jgi:hypothetical protein
MMYVDEDRKERDDTWWEIGSALQYFNHNQMRNIATSNIIAVMDESMSVFHPCTTITGNLPHIKVRRMNMQG